MIARINISIVTLIIALLLITQCKANNEKMGLDKFFIKNKIETIYNTGNVEIIDELFAKDYVSHTNLGEGIKGTQGIKNYLTAIRTAFPDLRVSVEDIIIEGDKIAIRRVFQGTNSGPIKFPGLNFAPTGKKVRWTDMGFLYFKNGKIQETYQIMDSLGLMQQLGLASASK